MVRGLLVGLLAALVLHGLGRWRLARAARGPGSAAVALWVADRDRQALFGLDDELIVRAAVPWRTPLRLERGGGGLLWIVSAPSADPRGAHRLSLVDPRRPARPLVQLELGPVLALRRFGAGVCWLERQGDAVLLGRVGADGDAARIRAPPGARLLAAAGTRLLVGTEDDRLWGFDGGWTALRLPRGELLDLARSGQRWWVLAGAGAGDPGESSTLMLYAAEAGGGTEPAVWRLGGRGGRLVPCAGPDGVWVVGDRRARRVGAGARDLPVYLRGATGGLTLPGGGLAVLFPGAVVRKGPGGAPLPGQGGFGWIADGVTP